MKGKLMCGAARVSITPPKELVPKLKGLAGQSYCDVLDDLYVRAIALSSGEKTVLVMCFELDKVPYPREYSELISRTTGIPEENILLTAIHTHCAPVTGYRPDEGPNSKDKFAPEMLEATEEYDKILAASVEEACRSAVGSMVPCRMGWCDGESYINVNRNETYYAEQADGTVREECMLGSNGSAPVDRTVFVMKLESLEGNTIALFVNYAVHCCVAIGHNYDGEGHGVITCDLGGRVSAMLEKKYGGVAMWTSGAAGDVNPVMLNEYHVPDPISGKCIDLPPAGCEYAFKALELQSMRHTKDIINTVRKIKCDTDTAELDTATGWSCTPGRALPGEAEAAPYRVRLRLLRLGELAVIGVSGELYSSIGAEIRELLPVRTVIINHESTLISNAAYIFDDKTLMRCQTGGDIPGYSKTRMQCGYIEEALKNLSRELYEKCF